MDYCQRCGTKTNGNTYCEQCDRELFTMSDTAQKLLSEEGLPTVVIHNRPTYKERKCMQSDKPKVITSRYYEEHYKEEKKEARVNTRRAYDTIHIDTSNFIPKEQKQKTHHNISKKYNKNKSIFINSIKKLFSIDTDKKDTQKNCALCGGPSGKYRYCYDCYQIMKPEYTANPEDKYNNNIWKTKCGYMVRSQQERTISDFLTDNGIEHLYETRIPVDKNKNHDIKPDFYIRGPVRFNDRILKNIYIEHWGLHGQGDESYDNSEKYKIPIYNKYGITVINTYKEDIQDYEKSLTYKLTNYIEGTINYLKES